MLKGYIVQQIIIKNTCKQKTAEVLALCVVHEKALSSEKVFNNKKQEASRHD